MLCGYTLPLNGTSQHVLLLWDNKYGLQDQFNDCIFNDWCPAPHFSFLHHAEASPVYFCSYCLGTQSLGQGARTFKTRRHIVSPLTASQRAPFHLCSLSLSKVLSEAIAGPSVGLQESRFESLVPAMLLSVPWELLSEESSFVSVLYSSVVNSDHWSQCLNRLIKVYCFPTVEAVEEMIAVVKFVLCYCTQQVSYPK